MKLLQFNNFFGNFAENESFETLTEKELFFGQLLLHFTNSLPQNIHDIAVLETSEVRKWVNTSEIKSLGAGVYLTGALFNHSCDPSFMRVNVGKSLVSVANRNIPRGEEISECYGQMYYNKNTDTRREALRRHYKFECQCPACLYNYPTIKELHYAAGKNKETKHSDLLRVKCTTCGQMLERIKGVKVKEYSNTPCFLLTDAMCVVQVGEVLTCLVCGQETRVSDIPLAPIR